MKQVSHLCPLHHRKHERIKYHLWILLYIYLHYFIKIDTLNKMVCCTGKLSLNLSLDKISL